MTSASTRDEIVQRIHARHHDLRELGVASLSLFGSSTRDRLTDDSDVDVLVRFDGKATFDAFMDLKLLLEGCLGRRVDLVTETALRPQLRQRIAADLLRVA